MIRLLVADDSALMRKLLREVFTAEGDFEVAVARDGAEALSLAASFRPDVVTLDVTMPVMDGLACLRRLMAEAPCPVVMVSALTADGAEATLEALALGAVDYVPKPGGAVTLHLDALRPLLVQKVRTAAGVRLSRALRLRDRVRHRLGRAGEGDAARPPAGAVPLPDAAGLPPAAAGDKTGRLLVIGASTGGPAALEAVLSGLPAGFPLPVLVAQHMPAAFTGPFAARLDRLCPLPVAEVTRPTPLLPGHAYVARGDADMLVSRRAAGLVALPAPASPLFPWHPSVDRLVRSAAQAVGPASLLGVLLTGMGRDGAEALAEVRAGGGWTLAEAEETAVVWGMPGELVRLGGAGQVAPVLDIARAVIREVGRHAAGQTVP